MAVSIQRGHTFHSHCIDLIPQRPRARRGSMPLPQDLQNIRLPQESHHLIIVRNWNAVIRRAIHSTSSRRTMQRGGRSRRRHRSCRRHRGGRIVAEEQMLMVRLLCHRSNQSNSRTFDRQTGIHERRLPVRVVHVELLPRRIELRLPTTRQILCGISEIIH